ncbi:MAG: hypothetical protein R3B96_19430 [Pirellulaceae bacterium]
MLDACRLDLGFEPIGQLLEPAVAFPLRVSTAPTDTNGRPCHEVIGLFEKPKNPSLTGC